MQRSERRGGETYGARWKRRAERRAAKPRAGIQRRSTSSAEGSVAMKSCEAREVYNKAPPACARIGFSSHCVRVLPEVVGKSPTTKEGRAELSTSPNMARRVGGCEGVRREEPSVYERPSALAQWGNSRTVRGAQPELEETLALPSLDGGAFQRLRSRQDSQALRIVG